MNNENWGAEPWRAPTLGKDDVALFSEHGRVIHPKAGRTAVDFRSHWLILVKNIIFYALLVKHGGGEERIVINGFAIENGLVPTLESADSDTRYLLLYALYSTHQKATRLSAEKTASLYRKAFAEGRLKKRKQRNSETVKVWIDA